MNLVIQHPCFDASSGFSYSIFFVKKIGCALESRRQRRISLSDVWRMAVWQALVSSVYWSLEAWESAVLVYLFDLSTYSRVSEVFINRWNFFRHNQELFHLNFRFSISVITHDTTWIHWFNCLISFIRFLSKNIWMKPPQLYLPFQEHLMEFHLHSLPGGKLQM